MEELLMQGAVPDPHKTVGQHQVFPPALGVWSDRPREKPQQCIANRGYVGVTQQMYRCVYVQDAVPSPQQAISVQRRLKTAS
ncbi:hypothetical protein AV530_012899 [Patagioenas fasciata monilis]|uniref:Uncharacterized protein n=1 Tax=Patagioenas fasciata monilis TaxID=372326 RepID=A0A1V4J9D9_PATFA|nr:hypothetical protein AV530_012899 [Patagioenas fasciata monilis]